MRKSSRKSRGRLPVKRTSVGYFSLRGAWDALVVLFLLAVVGCLSYYMQKHSSDLLTWPPIKQVKVEGNLRPADYEIFKGIVITHVSKGLLRISTSQLAAELEELPWIHRVQSGRSWPNTLEVTVQGQDPIARWGKSGLINVQGEIFFPESMDAYTTSPMLYGDEARAPELVREFENSVKSLEPLGLKLQGLFEDKRHSKQMVLSNGIILVAGDGSVSKKITRFIAAYEQYLSPNINQVKKIDLRYTNGLAVEWKDPQLAGDIEPERAL